MYPLQTHTQIASQIFQESSGKWLKKTCAAPLQWWIRLRARDYYTIPTTRSCTTTTNFNHSWTRTTPTTKDPRCESCVILSFVVFELIFWLPSEAPWLFFFFFLLSLSPCAAVNLAQSFYKSVFLSVFRSPISLNLNGFCHTVTHSV